MSFQSKLLSHHAWEVLNVLSLCFPLSPPHRKEPVGGETDALEIKERKKKIEDNADALTSLPGYLGQKDHDALLAMRDQARLVSTAIQLLTSPESNCLSSSPSIYHKVCSNEAAEPCDLEKPQPHSQVRVLWAGGWNVLFLKSQLFRKFMKPECIHRVALLNPFLIIFLLKHYNGYNKTHRVMHINYSLILSAIY